MPFFRAFACLALAITPLLVAACGGGAGEPGEDEGETSEAALTGARVIGDLESGYATGNTTPADPGKRAFSFDGLAGDVVDVWVRSDTSITFGGADAIAWIVTSSGSTIAFNDNASTFNKDAHMHAVLTTSGKYYVVFREKNAARTQTSIFNVAMTVACPIADQVVSSACGAGGKREKLCVSSGPGAAKHWTPYGACANEVVGGCIAGSSVQESCGQCGTRTKTCTAANTWAPGPCYGEPVTACTPNSVQKSAAGCSVPGTYRHRTCSSACTWDWFTATCAP